MEAERGCGNGDTAGAGRALRLQEAAEIIAERVGCSYKSARKLTKRGQAAADWTAMRVLIKPMRFKRPSGGFGPQRSAEWHVMHSKAYRAKVRELEIKFWGMQ